MGTRGLIHIKEDNKTILTLYRQYDCYESGLGLDIVNLLAGGQSELTNGYSGNQANPKVFNGMGCLAAALVKGLKDGIGNVYVYPANSKDCGEEFTYTLFSKNGAIHIKVKDVYADKITYNGPLSKYNPKGRG